MAWKGWNGRDSRNEIQLRFKNADTDTNSVVERIGKKVFTNKKHEDSLTKCPKKVHEYS